MTRYHARILIQFPALDHPLRAEYQLSWGSSETVLSFDLTMIHCSCLPLLWLVKVDIVVLILRCLIENPSIIYLCICLFIYFSICARFSKDLYLMTGKHVKSKWRICWKFISPLIILGVIIGGIVQMIKAMAAGQFTYTAWDRTQVKQSCTLSVLSQRMKCRASTLKGWIQA